MKKITFLGVVLLWVGGWTLRAANFVNLTPAPKGMTVNNGTLDVPSRFDININITNDTTVQRAAWEEAKRFADNFNKVGFNIMVTTDNPTALFQLSKAPSLLKLGEEGYSLKTTAEQVTIKASGAAGFYYAFQTIKKISDNPIVYAGTAVDDNYNADDNVSFHLPFVSISTDIPRFSYRGFMLDVSRHFFTIKEVKEMIEVMSWYKLNTFHWHLSDDQGWRVEIKKYPKLTTVGATASNAYVTDLKYGTYHINKTYGPYFYTQAEIKEVVAFAAERHIEIIPEIDMPGHFVAAMAAYPEYSCWPNGSHAVWTSGGISSDVLNVGNPDAVEFAKDILSELVELFPSKRIHIGGDECPTSAWESNALCKKRYEELGLTSYRQLQSVFIKEISDFLRSKGKEISVWNEAITASGADTELIKETGANVYAWQPADAGARKAANLDLDAIYTPWGPYYINRQQSQDAGEQSLPGDGSDTVEKTYKVEAVPTDITTSQADHYIGVQGTFWTEHVADRYLMQYLAMPRLMAVAEAGWTPKGKKDFESFRQRITADTLFLDAYNYIYARHYLVNDKHPKEQAVKAEMPVIENGRKYVITNITPGYEGQKITDIGLGDALAVSTERWVNSAWEAQHLQTTNDTITLQFVNTATKRRIAAPAASATGQTGWHVGVGNTAATLRLDADTYYPSTTGGVLTQTSCQIANGGRYLFPLREANCISSGSTTGGSNAVRPQGTAWNITEVVAVTYYCKDEGGHHLGTYTEYVPARVDYTLVVPEIRNFHAVTYDGQTTIPTIDATKDTTIEIVYCRDAYTLTFEARDTYGALLLQEIKTIAVDEAAYEVSYPDIPYYKFQQGNHPSGTTLMLTSDTVVVGGIYFSEAYSGVRAVGEAVTELQSGRSYLIYDACTTEQARRGFRTIVENTSSESSTMQIFKVNDAAEALPYTPWTLVKSGTGFKVKNEYTNLYVPSITTATTPVAASTTGAVFKFTTNSDGTWKIKGTNNVCWDGLASGALVGWNDPGHPYIIYEYFVEPYFELTVECYDDEGQELAAAEKCLLKAGTPYTINENAFEGMILDRVETDANLAAVDKNATVKIYYKPIPTGIIDTDIDFLPSYDKIKNRSQSSSSIIHHPSSILYDLSGRPLPANAPTKGVYIDEGKVVFRN